ncbi:hypothetical protein BpOF4_04905 [Alkalihalophilus pseudofirmus OF4]|uniref:Uncharacterized protein n=1 Tax=Alkalihalophilus pseudofirmus (strain ATCC BAA-2126 / JCM 17055 / OF4) TaxID=398511 RepID=D3FZ12_ALKPO|nr:hypothetical protein BpOF4_04905 [Alkalihalophilus pseudofirmus OF4]
MGDFTLCTWLVGILLERGDEEISGRQQLCKESGSLGDGTKKVSYKLGSFLGICNRSD